MSFQDGKFPRDSIYYDPPMRRNTGERDVREAIEYFVAKGYDERRIEQELYRQLGVNIVVKIAPPKRIEVESPPIVVNRTTEKRKSISKKINDLFRDTAVQFRQALDDVRNDEAMKTAIEMFETRKAEWDPAAMMLAGAYLNPAARKHVDTALDDLWFGNTLTSKANEKADLIIGGGLHAAIYAAIVHRKTGIKPVVIDSGKRVGGTFAMTPNPTFYLNSRNRPGPLGLPSGRAAGSLNYIPGAPVQPADLSSDEYADNATLGWAIRMTLALHAEVISQRKVDEIVARGVVVGGVFVPCKRVIVATGVGRDKWLPTVPRDSERVMSYSEFMRRMDSPFPMQGLGRVAVIGGGDGGKTVIEALTGQGPARSMSVAALDYMSGIDWYDGNLPRNCEAFTNSNRSRYKGIGRNLPRQLTRSADDNGNVSELTNGSQRVSVVQLGANDISIGYDEVMVNGKPYDNVVLTIGYDQNTVEPLAQLPRTNSGIEQVGGMQVARSWRNGSIPIVAIGPASDLALTNQETQSAPELNSIPDNLVSIFRYARKTAALADAIN